MYLEKFRLGGRVAVVTGGGQGIGLACSEALGEAGARIIIADNPLNEISIAKELLPPSLDAVIARHGTPEFQDALANAVCLAPSA